MSITFRAVRICAAVAGFALFSGGQGAAQSTIPIVDNRFVIINLTTADPEHTNRNYQSRDFQLNAVMHYNTRLALTSGLASISGAASAPALPSGPGAKPARTAPAAVKNDNGLQ